MMGGARADAVSIALLGDIILNKKCSHLSDEPFVALMTLLAGCDVVLGNLEGLYHDWEMSYGSNYNPYPIVNPKAMLDEVKRLGLSAVSAANNHAYDCGEAGLVANLENCRAVGLPAAGVGFSRGEARDAVYLETDGGRIAFLAGTTTFGLPDLSHAGPAGIGVKAKPGVAIVRSETFHTVPPDVFAALAAANAALSALPVARDAREIQAFGGRVSCGEGFSTTSRCHPVDLDEIGRSIRSAKAVSDLAVYTVHCHENGTDGAFYNALHRPSVPDFLRELARHCIDQGCDIFFAHGPHILKGLEIYKGKPIFYSLGDFVFQPETVPKTTPASFAAVGLPQEDGAGAWGRAFLNEAPYAWGKEKRCYQSVVPICTFADGTLQGIRLIPVELGMNASHAHRGRPCLARGTEADDIYDWMTRLSAPFGTEIADGPGFVSFARL